MIELPRSRGLSIWHHFGEAAQEVGSVTKERQDPLLARFKHLAGMNVDEQGWPQFGRWAVTHHDTSYSLFMTCLPAACGDEILIHLSGRPPLKRILVRARSREEIWMHLAGQQSS